MFSLSSACLTFFLFIHYPLAFFSMLFNKLLLEKYFFAGRPLVSLQKSNPAFERLYVLVALLAKFPLFQYLNSFPDQVRPVVGADGHFYPLRTSLR